MGKRNRQNSEDLRAMELLCETEMVDSYICPDLQTAQ